MSNYSQLIVVGDFNFPDINWNLLSGSSPVSSSFCDTVFSLNLVQLVDEATHSCGNILDLVLTTIPGSIHNLYVDRLTCSSVSDHCLITFDVALPIKRKSPKPSLTYDYSRADFNELEFFFLDSSFKDCFLLREVNSVWSSFKSVFFKGCDTFIPTTKKHSKSAPPWFNSNIRHRINCVKTLKCSLAQTPTQTKMFRLSCMETELQALIQTSKLTYEHYLISTFHSNSKKLFSHLKSISTQKSCIGTLMHNSSPVTDPTHKAELFNNYFNSTFTRSFFCSPPN